MASMIPILPLVFLLFTTFYNFGEATRLIAVGGSLDAWKVPESPNHTLNHWAQSVRFKVGDTLWWTYDAKKDSVLQVTEENYEHCKTEKPLKEYKDGNTKVELNVSGPYFFISGAPTGNCAKGEKLTVVVQSPNHSAMPKPLTPATPTPTPNPSTSPATPTPSPKPSNSPASPTPSPKPSMMTPAPAPAPEKNSAVELMAGNSILWALVAFIGLAFV